MCGDAGRTQMQVTETKLNEMKGIIFMFGSDFLNMKVLRPSP